MVQKISVYVRSKDTCPSAYYRLLQYLKEIKKNDTNIKVRTLLPPSIYKWYQNQKKNNQISKVLIEGIVYIIMVLRTSIFLFSDSFIYFPKIVIIQREVTPRYIPFIHYHLLRYLAKRRKLLWDFDDNIFESKEISVKERSLLINYSSSIIVISEYLKLLLPHKIHPKVILMPTTDGDMQNEDQKDLEKRRNVTYQQELRLIWVGTSGNLRYLHHIMNALDEASLLIKQRNNKQLILTVVCNKPLICNVQNLHIVNITWNKKIAIEEMKNAHVGIMPLINDTFALGKGGFKLIQYFSIGLPVIASAVGFNKEILNKHSGYLIDDLYSTSGWVKALLLYASDWETYSKKGNHAYSHWISNFSYKKNLEKWTYLLHNT